MAISFKTLYCFRDKIISKNLFFYRSGHTMRGKPHGVALSLAQRIAKENAFQEANVNVDIGFPEKKSTQYKVRKQATSNLKNQNLSEKDLTDVKDESEPVAQLRLKKIAEHYGIYKDLFKSGYFIPRVPLKITYTTPRGCCSVFNGNIIKPTEATNSPKIEYNGNLDSFTEKGKNYWLLMLLNPDGNSSGVEGEQIHWFIANILENNVENGEVIVPYLQPLPLKGLGYQRYIFLLFKQNSIIDFSSYTIQNNTTQDHRLFNTEKFYKKYEDHITPAGLSFFQSNWDDSVTSCFNSFGNAEPSVEYDFPKPYIADPKWFPLKQPFDAYMDKHRTDKEVNSIILKKYLEEKQIFNEEEIKVRFPNAQPIKHSPSWLTFRIKKDRLKPSTDKIIN